MCYLNVTLSVDNDVMREARRRADAMGTSVNQLVREFLEQFAGQTDPEADAAGFERFRGAPRFTPADGKFDPDELHERP